ncbi:MAG TPA: hypothetical protein VFO70_10480 [Chitinophagaceae bacterium]|nr:hypothetical protein [Chitinophagaceae bacterium]
MRLVNNFSTKLFKSAALLLLTAITFVSCQKDNDDPIPATASVEGLYIGKYGFDNDAPDTDYKLNFKAGGILQEIGPNSGSVVGQGTWQVSGNTVTGVYVVPFPPNNKYSISASFNPTTKKLTGTWGYDENPADGGKFEMTKQ